MMAIASPVANSTSGREQGVGTQHVTMPDMNFIIIIMKATATVQMARAGESRARQGSLTVTQDVCARTVWSLCALDCTRVCAQWG